MNLPYYRHPLSLFARVCVCPFFTETSQLFNERAVIVSNRCDVGILKTLEMRRPSSLAAMAFRNLCMVVFCAF